MVKLRFNDLSDEQIEYLRKSYFEREENKLTVEKLASNIGNEWGISERTIRKWFVKLKFKNKKDVEPVQYAKAKSKTHDETKKRFIVSWCQNNTQINKKFLKNIKALKF